MLRNAIEVRSDVVPPSGLAEADRFDVARIARGVRKVQDGFWESDAPADVSYPADGHEWFAGVEEQSFWFRHRNRLVAWMVKAHAAGALLFDIGGGNGIVSQALQLAGERTVLVEPGPRGVEHARARGLPLVVRSTFDGAGFLPSSVEAFGLFDVLEHVEDDAALLRSLRECLRPGGWLFLTVPASPALWSATDVRARHFRRYSLRGLRRIMRANGLEAGFGTYFFAALAPAVLVARAIPNRFGIPAGARSRSSREHRLPGGLLGSGLSRVLDWEHRRITSRRPVPFGTSCLLAARRPA